MLKSFVIIAAGVAALAAGLATSAITYAWFGKPVVQVAGVVGLAAGAAVFWIADRMGITSHDYSKSSVLFQDDERHGGSRITPEATRARAGSLRAARPSGVDEVPGTACAITPAASDEESSSSEALTNTHTTALTREGLRAAGDCLKWRVGDTLFTHFEIEAIRSGGMGIVFLCRKPFDDSTCAIKTVRFDPLADEQFRQLMTAEAETWLLLDRHPNIVRCDNVLNDQADGRLWLELERIDGHPDRGITLDEWIRSGPLDTDAIVRVIGGVCEAMAYVAAFGIAHCDLKPANVLMTAGGFAKVTDFGIAQPVQSASGDGLNDVVGTPAYMPPEAWSSASPRSSSRDVYALGIMLWQLLTGRHPFAGHDDLRSAHHYHTPADPRSLNANAPEWLSRMAVRCLAKARDDRPTFGELLDELRNEAPHITWSAVSASDGPGAADSGAILSLIKLHKFHEAEKRLASALRHQPDLFQVQYVASVFYRATGRPAEARPFLERVSRGAGNAPGNWQVQSEALRHLGKLDAALAAIERGLERHPGVPRLLIEKARVLHALGRLKEAVVLLLDVSRLPTESGIEATVLLAEISERLGFDDNGDRFLDDALARLPNHVPALVLRGHRFLKKGNPAEALEYARRASRIAPRSRGARALEVSALEALGDDAQVEALLRRIVQDTPDDLEAHATLGSRLLARDPDEARRFLARALKMPARHAGEYQMKGALMSMFTDDLAGALAQFNSAVELEPSVPSFWVSKAEAHIAVGELAPASNAYRRALALTPRDSVIAEKFEALQAFSRGCALLPSAPLDALREFDDAVARDPGNWTMLFHQMQLLTQLNRPGEALPVIDRLLDLLINAGPVLRWAKVQCLWELRAFHEAHALARDILPRLVDEADREPVQRCLSTDPGPERSRADLAAAWYNAAIAAQKQSNFPQAQEFMYRAVYLDGGNPNHLAGLTFCLLVESLSRPARWHKVERCSMRRWTVRVAIRSSCSITPKA